MVYLKLIATVNPQLSQTKGKKNNDTTVFSGLTLIIMIRDFYQFLLIVEKSL